MEPIESFSPQNNIKKFYIGITFVFVFVVSYFLFSAPAHSTPTTIHIAKKESLHTLSIELKNKNVIRSTRVFELFVKVFKGDKGIQTGDYFFENNFSSWRIAWMVARGYHNVTPVRITLREGLTNENIAEILFKNLPNFNKDRFMSEVKGKQGRLFPDTYFIFPLSTIDEIVSSMEDNFDNHMDELNKDIKSSNHNLTDIIKMASIIEKESAGESDAPTISGILWKRISMKMPLQVDASPVTYKVVGLPSESISNPGIVAIKAAIYPKDSPYLYYLHDKGGVVHYAVTFKEHKSNIAQYLK